MLVNTHPTHTSTTAINRPTNAKSIKPKRTRKPLSRQKLEERAYLKTTFPETGKVRAKQIAAYLDIGESTWWKLSADGVVPPPTKLGQRVSVWDAELIHDIAKNGVMGEAA